MTLDINSLTPEFSKKAQELLDLCASNGLVVRPTFFTRSLATQAKLWRQSRSREEIQGTIDHLNSEDCGYLATILEAVGPQSGPWATNSLPGLSWHNWGQAMDVVYVSLNGVKATDEQLRDGNSIGYTLFGQYCNQLGLRWGGDFQHPDYDHVQLNLQEITTLYTIKEVNDHFEALGAE